MGKKRLLVTFLLSMLFLFTASVVSAAWLDELFTADLPLPNPGDSDKEQALSVAPQLTPPYPTSSPVQEELPHLTSLRPGVILDNQPTYVTFSGTFDEHALLKSYYPDGRLISYIGHDHFVDHTTEKITLRFKPGSPVGNYDFSVVNPDGKESPERLRLVILKPATTVDPFQPLPSQPLPEVTSQPLPQPISQPCVPLTLNWDRTTAQLQDQVNIVLTTRGACTQPFTLTIIEEDLIFDTTLTTLTASTVNNKAVYSFMLNPVLLEPLFDTFLEGNELELRAILSPVEIMPLPTTNLVTGEATREPETLSLFEELLSEDSLPPIQNQPITVQPTPSLNRVSLATDILKVTKKPPILQSHSNYIGKGCTTWEDIDWDCDEHGVGPNLPDDADDEDPDVHTPASVIAKYGDPERDLNNLRKLLKKRGYTVNDMFFVDVVKGNDKTGSVNDITKPYKTTRSLVHTNYGRTRVVKPGDAIIFRQGKMAQLKLIDTQPEPDIHLSGAPGKPVLVMTYPGEEFVINSKNYPFGTGKGDHVIYDGFVVRSESGVGFPGIKLSGANNVVLRNIEVTNYKWGVHSDLSPEMHDILLERMVSHNMPLEHCYYIASRGGPNGGHHRITLKDSLGYRCQRHAFQINGNSHHNTVEDNIFHTNSYGGISLINGVTDSVFRNNKIVNNVRDGVILYTYWHDQVPYGTKSNDRNTFENNLIWVGREKTGMEEGSDHPSRHTGILFKDNYPDNNFVKNVGGRQVTFPGIKFAFTDNKFANNVIVTSGTTSEPKPIFNSYQTRHVAGTTFENNLFYMQGSDEVLVTNFGTDGTHDRYQKGQRNLDQWYWKLATLQNHKTWKNNIKRNLEKDPLFLDVAFSYARTPEKFKFFPTEQSPNINLGRQGRHTPDKDLQGNPRVGLPDASVYEFDGKGNQPPTLLTMQPSTVNNDKDNTVVVTGNNIDIPGASVLINGRKYFEATPTSKTTFDLFVPKGTPEYIYELSVRNKDGQESNKLPLTVRKVITQQNQPKITAITPKQVNINQPSVVQIIGEHLYEPLILVIEGQPTVDPSFYVQSNPTTVLLRVPEGAQPNTYNVQLITQYGISNSYPLILSKESLPRAQVPVVERVDPSTIYPNQGPSLVSIYGKHFTGVTGINVGNKFLYPPKLYGRFHDGHFVFLVPENVPAGSYNLKLVTHDFQTSKPFEVTVLRK